MIRPFVLVIAVYLFSAQILAVPVVAENYEQDTLSTIDQMADEALYFANMKRYDETKKVLEKMGEMIENSTHTNLPLSLDEQRILQVAYFEAEKLLESDNPESGELVRVLTKFRLATDALATEHEPLWIEMETTVMDALQRAKDSITGHDKHRFRDEFQRFLSIYDTVYPGIILDVPVEKVKTVDTQIQYVENYADEMLARGDLIVELESLHSELQALFERTEEDEADPSLWWVIISTGGIIILTLSYVGWKKYKGEKEKRQQYKKEQKY